MARVYVSSTFNDLKDHRESVRLISQVTTNSHAFARAIGVYGLSTYYAQQAETFNILYTQFFKEQDKFPRTHIIKALGEYFHNKDEVLSLMVQIAKTDASPYPADTRFSEPYYAREAAVDALYRFWPTHKETLSVLEDRIVNDNTPWMKDKAKDLLKKIQEN